MADRLRQRSPLAVAVLALLKESPMHAYRMHELIKERGKDKVVNVAQRNSVYQTINRLLRAGLIKVQKTSRHEGRPERVAYQLTDDGAETLHQWMREMLSRPASEFPELPVALSFIAMLAPAEVIALMDARTGLLDQQLAKLSAETNAARKNGLPRLFLLDDEFQQTMLRAEIAWMRALLEDLRSKKVTWSLEWLRKIAKAHSSE
jgi:DNA-binding PadR family transcriptional regulator